MKRKLNADLDMRIGIHTGNIIAGITGSTIVRYDVYGPDNVIANQLESTGRPGSIHVSEQTLTVLLNAGLNLDIEQAEVVFSESLGICVDSYYIK